jgi:hypothetical protein
MFYAERRPLFLIDKKARFKPGFFYANQYSEKRIRKKNPKIWGDFRDKTIRSET